MGDAPNSGKKPATRQNLKAGGRETQHHRHKKQKQVEEGSLKGLRRYWRGELIS